MDNDAIVIPGSNEVKSPGLREPFQYTPGFARPGGISNAPKLIGL